MSRGFICCLVAVLLATGAPATASAATPSPDSSPTGESAEAVSAPLDEADEPYRIPDDPPTDPGPPERPSTVLEEFRSSALPDRSRARSLSPTTENRVVGSVIAAGAATVLHDATLAAIGTVADRTMMRSAGGDRYDTAVRLSADHFPNGARDVWLATGQNFPDGLTASSVAGARGGPVLLTRPDELPANVLAELQRLAPQNIWVVGGSGAVSGDVADAVGAAMPDAEIERLDGDDRYDTAAELAEEFFESAATVFVATGQDFPDALSAGPAAARAGAPTLLVSATRVPEDTAEELRRLRPSTVYVIGGASVVSDNVVTRIRSLTGAQVERVAGPDRYATAAAVADRFFAATTPSLVLATGSNFPDSVAAGAVAGASSSPLLLVDGSDVPPRVTVDAARRVSWWLPDTGRVLRYTLVAHPDDEFAAWSIVGDRDPRRYDVFIVLTTGESTGYCTGAPISNQWSAQQYTPQPQPTGARYSERCKQHRMDSWHVFVDASGFGPIAPSEQQTSGPTEFEGREIPIPLRRDETDAIMPANDYTLSIGQDTAIVSFDMGALTSDEVLWAVETTRALTDRLPAQVEGDIIGAGFYNDAPTGYENLHPDHHAVHELLSSTDLGLPGSQYATVGHAQEARVFGASVTDYCGAMCHPGDPGAFAGEMGRFQYAYGWLASGRWLSGAVDVPAGFSEYQSFAKWF